MGKGMRFWVLVAIFSLLVPASALAGPKGQGQGQGKGAGQGGGQTMQQQKWSSGQPPGWGQGSKSGWSNKGTTVPPGLQKKDQLPKGIQKKSQ